MSRSKLDTTFPFADILNEFLAEYRRCRTYWYVQTARTLRDVNASSIAAIMRTIEEDFRDKEWTQEAQYELLDTLTRKGILDPYKPSGPPSEGSALAREWKKLLETLGFLWVQPNRKIVVTDAGLDLLTDSSPSDVIERQIAKIQYPNPSLKTGHASDFKGLLPHLFLLQVLQRCSYRVDVEELELFLNLAQSQQDVDRIVRYVECWRDLQDSEKENIREIIRRVKMKGALKAYRVKRIRQNSSYQRALLRYPTYVQETISDGKRQIVCTAAAQLDDVVADELPRLKISTFDSLPEWFAYFGDPDQRPSWYTYLSLRVQKATSEEEAKELVEEHGDLITPGEKAELVRKQVEKGIENFYAANLHLIEDGLKLLDQQFATAIGPIDILCKDSSGQFVVIEVKAEEAKDSVFGQLLRYIGWVHRNMDGGHKNVRGVIVARDFPERARYSRIGLSVLTDDHEDFIKFKPFTL